MGGAESKGPPPPFFAMISAKSYFGCVSLIMLLTFVCGFLFVFAYVTVVGMIASGFSVSPIPVWAREDILEWMDDVPQQTDPYVTQDGFLVFKGPKVPPNFAGSDQLGGHTPEYTQPISASGSLSEYENSDDGGGGGAGGRSNAVMESGNGGRGGSNGVIGEREQRGSGGRGRQQTQQIYAEL